MPRELPKPNCDTCKNCIPVAHSHTDYSDLKIKTLSENINKLFIPYNLKDKESIEEATVDNLSNEAYIYVDDDGKPTKLLALTVLRKEIDWDDLSADVKQQIQETIERSKLHAGNHITIDANNTISADIGVETINGKTGVVNLTAADVGAYSREETCTIAELEDTLESLNLTLDGGLVE